MDITKLIEFLHQYPSWYRSAIWIWVTIGAVLGGGLIFLKSENRVVSALEVDQKPLTVQQENIKVKQPAESASTVVSSEKAMSLVDSVLSEKAYFSTIESLSDRFLEKHEFLEKLSGKAVEWQGLVDKVSQRGSYIFLLITVEDVFPERSIYVAIPESLRTKVFSLQKGDLVSVKGRLSLPTPNMPDVEAAELILLKVRNAGR